MTQTGPTASPPTPPPAFTPFLAGLIARHAWEVVDMARLDHLAPATPLALLFLAGDAGRLVESHDVAVVLPELAAWLKGQLGGDTGGGSGGDIAIWVAARGEERLFQRRFRCASFPALVMLRGGGYLGAIEGMRDWVEYQRDLAAILRTAPHEPPPWNWEAHDRRAHIQGRQSHG